APSLGIGFLVEIGVIPYKRAINMLNTQRIQCPVKLIKNLETIILIKSTADRRISAAPHNNIAVPDAVLQCSDAIDYSNISEVSSQLNHDHCISKKIQIRSRTHKLVRIKSIKNISGRIANNDRPKGIIGAALFNYL